LKFAEDGWPVNRADVSGVGAGGDRDSGVLERFQILQGDVISFLDAIERGIRIGERGLNAIGQLVRRQFRDVECRDHLRMPQAFSSRVRFNLFAKVRP
jgi:hypothetical protein